MIITDEAKKYIETVLEDNKAKGIRMYAVEGGCCGPSIGLSLDAPETADQVSEINGIKIAIAPQALSATEDMTLDFETTGGQSGLTMVGAPGCC